ncbi:MAG: M20/M25/M40 family metallo-hydrolase [Anaerolineae bacterium]
MDTYRAWIDQHKEELIADLRRLLRQPSISAQDYGIRECAGLVAEMLEEWGIAAQIHETARHPVVTGELEGRGDKTMLIYGHYDVQPPDPLELWEHDPFGAEVVDGRIYARGAVDDKGNMLAAIEAVRGLKELGQLPCRFKFIIEGEEEISSPSLYPFVAEHRDLLEADALAGFDGNVTPSGRPEVMLGMKGICYVEMSAEVGRDQHSSKAPLVPNPAWRLIWALNSLKGPDEQIKVPGFYDDVVPPTEQELAALEQMEWNEEALRQAWGVERFLSGRTGQDARVALLFEPTCTVCGFEAGYTGPGAKTVLPGKARCKVDFRLVPRQDPHDIFRKVRAHLDAQGFSDVDLRLIGALKASKTPLDAPVAQALIAALRDVFGVQPSVKPLVEGSGPGYIFEELLQIPQVYSGFGPTEDRLHSPNEYITVEGYLRGIEACMRFYAVWATL